MTYKRAQTHTNTSLYTFVLLWAIDGDEEDAYIQRRLAKQSNIYVITYGWTRMNNIAVGRGMGGMGGVPSFSSDVSGSNKRNRRYASVRSVDDGWREKIDYGKSLRIN